MGESPRGEGEILFKSESFLLLGGSVRPSVSPYLMDTSFRLFGHVRIVRPLDFKNSLFINVGLIIS